MWAPFQENIHGQTTMFYKTTSEPINATSFGIHSQTTMICSVAHPFDFNPMYDRNLQQILTAKPQWIFSAVEQFH